MKSSFTVSYPELLGQAIRDRRKELRLEQSALASRSGILQPTISRIERGEALLNSEQILRIADALELSPSEFWLKADEVKRSIERRGVTVVRDRVSSDLVKAFPIFLTGASLTAFLLGLVSVSDE